MLQWSAGNKQVPAKSTGAAKKQLIQYTPPSALMGKFGSQLVWRKPMSALAQNASSPAGSFIHLPIHHSAGVSLTAISLALTPPQVCGRNAEAQGPLFFLNAEKNEPLSLLTLSDEQCPDMAANGYVSPLFQCVTHWNDGRYGREWWIQQCRGSLRAEVELYRRNSFQGWYRSKIKGVWSLTVSRLLPH